MIDQDQCDIGEESLTEENVGLCENRAKPILDRIFEVKGAL